MQEFLSMWVSNQNVRGFSELHKLPSQQNQTFGTSCFRLAQESFFLTDWQSPYRVKGGLYRNLKRRKKKKKKNQTLKEQGEILLKLEDNIVTRTIGYKHVHEKIQAWSHVFSY